MNGIRANIDSDKSIDVLLHVIKEVVAELHPSWPKTGKILPESLLTQDLGLDSLARVELLTRVERSFGVTLEEKIFIDAETPRDLWQAIIKASPSLKPVAAGKIREVEIEDTPDWQQINWWKDQLKSAVLMSNIQLVNLIISSEWPVMNLCI